MKACVCLHNFTLGDDYSLTDKSTRYVPPGLIDVVNPSDGTIIEGTWRTSTGLGGFADIGRLGQNNYTESATSTRNEFREYFNSEGKVWWHYDNI